MRTRFIHELTSLAEHDPNVMLLVGDLGFSVVEEFAERFPMQFVNVGVAEQSMIGVAAGLAHSGKTVFVYSIGNFATLRCLEQIRNDVCYPGLRVVIITVGGGLAYGALGYSHHAIEDLAIMRSLPRIRVFSPGDPVEAAAVTRSAAALPGPSYIRLGKSGEKVCHDNEDLEFEVGQLLTLREPEDLVMLTTGAMLSIVLQSADRLAQRGVRAGVVSVPTIEPLDQLTIQEMARTVENLVTVEEHVGRGGLGSAIAEALADGAGSGWRLCRLYLPDDLLGVVGGRDYLLKRAGLDAEGIAQRVSEFLATCSTRQHIEAARG